MKEIKVLEGKVVAPEGMKVGIVASRFNEIIVNKLLGGAVDGLVRHGVEEENITAAWVPGAFEIPVAASAVAKSGKYDAIICVGDQLGYSGFQVYQYIKGGDRYPRELQQPEDDGLLLRSTGAGGWNHLESGVREDG